MSFRNAIARLAVENVQAYMNRFDTDEIETYIASAFSYHGEIPFLYQMFQRTTKVEPDPAKERGGYKVVSSSYPSSLLACMLTVPKTRHGLFRHQVILQTMLTYYRHIKSDVDTACLSGIHPVGALALVCTAVSAPPI